MFLDKIIKQINKLVSNSSSYQLTYDKLEFYLEKSIDHINQALFTNFRTPKEYFNDSVLYQNIMKYISNNTDCRFVGGISSFEFNTNYKFDGIPRKPNVPTNDQEIYYDYYNNVIRYMNNDEVYNISLLEEETVKKFFYFIYNLNIFICVDAENETITQHKISNPGITPYYTTLETLGLSSYDYNELPDRYIRSCLIYYTAALYLEEEDEFESQYAQYIDKAESELSAWKKQYFSCYDAKW